MSVLKGKSAPIREKRLQTVSAYLGEAGTLLQELKRGELKQRIRTFSQAAADDLLSVLHLLNGLDDVAVVIHGPRGCSASQLYFDGFNERKNPWAVTNLDEHDTIMGGDESLRQAIIKLHNRYHCAGIFVVATPVVAINNDDVFSVVEELRQELGVLIIPVYTNGFKSKTGMTGYDTVLHAALKHLPFAEGERTKQGAEVNVLAVTENRQDMKEIKRLLAALNLEANFLPRSGTLQSFMNAVRAQVSIGVNPDHCDYLGRVLAAYYQVPFLRLRPPLGIQGTQAWLAELGKALGLERQVCALHKTEKSLVAVEIARYNFTQVKVYINLPAALAWGVADLVEELGAQVAGLSVSHIDQLHQPWLEDFSRTHPDISLHVAQGQPFEQANILRRLQPDVFIGHAFDALWAAKSGIAAMAVDHLSILGYQGVVTVARQLKKALANRNFGQELQESTTLPYQAPWYGKNPNWHIKLEVK